MANRQITYGIGFNVDNSGLGQLKQELNSINSMTLRDLKLIDANATRAELDEIKQSANIVGDALEKSLNPKLGTINIIKFNESLKDSQQTIQQIETNFAKVGMQGTQSFRNLTSEIFTTKRELKESFHLIDSMATTLGNTIKWSVASGALNTVTGAIQKAWGYTQKLDTSLNDIRIVTEKSADEMERFAKQANKAAKELGASTTSYSNAALIYYQQGLEEEDVQARTQATVKAANVTGQSAAEVSEQLTAVWNGYKVVASEAETYVDKLAAVAATTAADLEELSDGMSKVSSSANAMGVDIDQLSAQLATIVSVTRQDASLVGTALKTIYARMGDLKVSGVDEFGTSLGDVSGQMRQMGIEVLDQEGNLREMGEVIEEVASKWDTWTGAQQQAAAIAIAGKRQYNNLIALFENWDMYESALITSQTSAGTLQKQQDIYMESLEAKLQKLATSGERVYDALFNSESMGNTINLVALLVDKIGALIEAIGGGGNLLLLIGSTATRLFGTQLAEGISKLVYNLGLVKAASQQSLAEFEILSKYQNSNDEAIKEMVKLKETELSYGKLVSQEEKEKFEMLIKQTAELHNQRDTQKKLIEDAEAYAKARLGKDVDVTAQRSSEKRKSGKTASKELLSQAEDLQIERSRLNYPKEYEKALKSTDLKLEKIQENRTKNIQKGVTLAKEFDLDEELINTSVENLKEEQKKIAKALFEKLQEQLEQMGEQLVLGDQTFNIEEFSNQIMKSPSQPGIDFEGIEESSELGKIQNLQEMQILIEKNIKLTEDEDRVKKELHKTETALRDTVQNAIDTNKIDLKNKNLLIDAIKEYGEAIERAEKSETRRKDIINAQIKLESKYSEALGKTEKQVKENAEILKQGVEPIKKINEKLGDLKKIKLDLTKQLQIKQGIQGATQLLGAFGQLASAINMIRNVKNILSNDSLSDFEKFTEIVTVAASVVPIFIYSIKGMKTGMFDVISAFAKSDEAILNNIAFLKLGSVADKEAFLRKMLLAQATNLDEEATKKYNEELAKMNLQQLLAQKGAEGMQTSLFKLIFSFKGAGAAGIESGIGTQLAWLPITLIVLAVVAALTIIVAVTVSIIKANKEAKITAEEAYKSAQEGAKAAKEEVQRLKSAYDELLDDMNELKESRLALDELKVGTEEWRQAVENLNFEIMELISKYPELAQFMTIDENGVYGIEQAGWDQLIQQQKVNLKQAQTSFLGATLNESRLKEGYLNEKNQEVINQTTIDFIKNDDLSRLIGEGILSLNTGGTSTQNLHGYQYTTATSTKYANDVKKLTDIGIDFTESTSTNTSGSTRYYADLDFSQLKDMSDENLVNIINSLDTIEIDPELKSLIKKQIDNIRDNNVAIENNQKIIDANTKAYLTAIGDEAGVDGGTYSTLVSISNAKNNGEVKTAEDFKFNNAFIAKSGENYLVRNTGKDSIDGLDYNTIVNNADSNDIGWNEINTSGDRKAMAYSFNEMARLVFGQDITTDIIESTFQGAKMDNLADVSFTIYDENGKELRVNADAVLNQYAQKLADAANKASNMSEEEYLKKMSEAGIADTSAAYFSTSYYDEENVKDYLDSEATLGRLNNLSGNDIKNKMLSTFGDTSYAQNIESAVSDFQDILNTELNKVIPSLGTEAAKNFKENFSADTAGFVNFTAQDFTDFSQSISKAAAVAGDGGAGIVSMLEQFKDSPEDLAKINDEMKNVDWTNTSSVNAFRAKLLEQGIIIDENNTAWNSFIKSINNGNRQWIQDSKKVIDNLVKIKEIAKDVSMGDVISVEDFQELAQITPEIASSFIKTADGYLALTGGDELSKKLKEQYKDLGAIEEQYTKIKEAAEKVDGDAYFNFDEKTQSEKANYFNDNTYEMLKALGYSDSQIDNIKKQVEIVKTSTDTSSNEYLGAEKALEGYANQINQAALDAENGEYDRSQAQEYFVTEIAGSWDEITSVWGDWSEDTREKAETYWKNQLLSEMGIADGFLASLSVEELEEYTKKVRDLEIDRLSQVQKKIDKISKATEKAFGKDRLDALNDMIDAQKEYANVAELRVASYQDVLDTRTENFVSEFENKFSKTIDISKGTNAVELDLEDLYLAQIDFAQESPEYEQIQSLIDLWESAEKASEKAEEAAENVKDAQLEAWDYQFELIDQARDTLKEWQDFRTEMAKVLSGAKGGAAFGELSFEESFENLTKNIAERYGESFEKADFSGLTKIDQLNSLKINPTAENNPFYDMEKINSIAKDWYESNTDGNWETANDTQKRNTYDLLFGQGQLDGAFNEAAFNEQMGEAVSTAEDQVAEAYDSLSELYELWLSGVEELSTLYQDQIDRLSNVNSLLSGSASLWKLVGKRIEGASDAVRSANEGMVNASINSAEIARRQAAALKVQYEKVKDSAEYSDKQKEAIYSAYMEAQQSALDLASEAVNKISEVFADNIALAIDDALAEVADNRTLAMLNEDWSRATAYDDRYLDEVNTAYAMDELDRAFQKSIDETDNIAAQNKLKQKQMEIEQRLNRILEERGKLSQAEIDRANAEYELTLKQIALEEAQRTASKMKLVRDSQGNYTYQYVADQDAVAEAEAEVAAAENDLYNLEKDQQKTAISDWFAMLQQAQTDIASAQTTGDAGYVTKVIGYYSDSLSKLQSEIIENPSKAFGEYANIIKSFDVDSLIANFNTEAGNVNNVNDKMITLQTTISNTLTEANAIANAELKVIENLFTNTIKDKAGNVVEVLDYFDYNNERIANTMSSIADTLKQYDLSGVAQSIQDATLAHLNTLFNESTLTTSMDGLKTALDDQTKAVNANTKALADSMDRDWSYYLDQMKNNNPSDTQ